MTNNFSERTAISDLKDVELIGREIRVYEAKQKECYSWGNIPRAN